MTSIESIKIVEENAGFSNSLVATWEENGVLKGVVVAWNVDTQVGNTIDIPAGLIPEGADVAFGVIPNGGKNANPTASIADVASTGAAATVFTIEGGPNDVTFDGQAITGSAGADLLLQSETKNPDRTAGEEFGDADDFAANDESGSDDTPDQEVGPTSATAAAGERDLNATPLEAEQIGFEDLANNSDGDFNDLIIEVKRAAPPPPPPHGGETDVSVPPPADGGPAVTVTTEFERTTDAFNLDALFEQQLGTGNVNIALIMDVSGSTSSSIRNPAVPIGDFDGDGRPGEFSDAEFAAVQEVSDFIAQPQFNGLDFDLGLIRFASRANLDGVFEPGFDVLQATIDAATSVGGGTNFEPPLQSAIDFFTQADPNGAEQNFVLFLSDGGASTTRLADELATLEESTGINATIRAVGFGSGASKPRLDDIDSGGDAAILDDPSLLPGELPAFLSPVSITNVELRVNGVLEETFGPDELSVVPGVGRLLENAVVDTAVIGDGVADLVEVEATDNNGNQNKIAFFVGEAGAAETYTLDAPIDPAPFIVGFNADQGDALVLNFATGTLALDPIGDDGDDFALLDNGTTIVDFIDTVGVSTVDDLFGMVA